MLNPWTSEGTCGQAPDTLHYRLRTATEPEARRIVLIHSLGLDGTLWNAVIAHLPASFTVCAYDCRGHGLSGAGGFPYSLPGFTEDLHRVLDHLSWPAADLVGCSLGGCIAMAFASRHPQRIGALTLIDTTAWYGPEAPQLWTQRAQTALNAGMGSLGARQIEQWLSEEFRNAQPQIVRDLLSRFERTQPASFAATCAVLGTMDLRPQIPLLSHPVHVIVGGEDRLTPPSAARWLAETIPGAELSILDGARHLTPLERAQQVALTLR